jgi:hypothetical protein
VKKAHAELAKGTLEVIVSEQGLASAGGQTNPKLNPVAMANKDDFKNIQAAAQSLVGEKKLVDIVTFAADWNVQKNPLGVPVTRTIAGAFIMKDGNRCKQYEYRAVQEHQGGGRYTDVPVFKNAYGNPLDIRSAGVVIVCP